MTNVHPRLVRQHGVVSAWQLRWDGLSRGATRHLVAGMRELHDGVYLSGHAPPTRRQLWWAAVSAAPDSVLAGASAAALHGFFRAPPQFEIVVRPGSGGPVRYGRLLVCRSTQITADTTRSEGLPVLTAERALLDLIAELADRRARRAVREALRVEAVGRASLRMICARHHGRRGVARLRAYADEYAPLSMERTQSDAEAFALAILDSAGVPAPEHNVFICGEEADLVWRDLRLIVELDGPDFHRFPTEDARKQQLWERAGWTVHRLPTQAVYDEPRRLLALAPPPNVRLVLP